MVAATPSFSEPRIPDSLWYRDVTPPLQTFYFCTGPCRTAYTIAAPQIADKGKTHLEVEVGSDRGNTVKESEWRRILRKSLPPPVGGAEQSCISSTMAQTVTTWR